MPIVTQATLSAEDSFCSPLQLTGWDPNLGDRPFDLAVWGDFSGTLTVQISYDAGDTWIDTGDTYSAPMVDRGFTATPCHIRCGFKSGNYTSGSAGVRIAQ